MSESGTGLAERSIQPAHRIPIHFFHLPVIGEKAVHLVFDIGQLGVDTCAYAFLHGGKDGAGKKRFIAFCQAAFILIFSISIQIPAEAVLRNLPGIAAEFGQRQSADGFRTDV